MRKLVWEPIFKGGFLLVSGNWTINLSTMKNFVLWYGEETSPRYLGELEGCMMYAQRATFPLSPQDTLEEERFAEENL